MRNFIGTEKIITGTGREMVMELVINLYAEYLRKFYNNFIDEAERSGGRARFFNREPKPLGLWIQENL